MDADKWIELTKTALKDFSTPFYLFSYPPVEERVTQLERAIKKAGIRIPVHHLLSVKTLPIPHLVKEWHRSGRGVEVVSASELSTALGTGVDGPHIVVNGVGKHHWLTAFAEPGLTVNFDSISEVRSLLRQAIHLRWRLGIRVAVSPMHDPDYPDEPAQFGMSDDDARAAVDYLRSEGADLDVLHFHLRSNVNSVSDFRTAVEECFELTNEMGLTPRFLDVGGGIPDFDVRQRNQVDVQPDFLSQYAHFLADAAVRFSSLDGLLLENGRYILGPAGILVVSVIDTKLVRGRRFLICDGGRTNHALESDWEEHKLLLLDRNDGASIPTTVCGPNCMAYDWIYKGELPEIVGEGNRFLYLNAGAYHLPWETRFSRGLCRVLWSRDGEDIQEIRCPEDFESSRGAWINQA